MPSQRNVQQLADLKDRVAKAKSIVFTDNSGLNALGQSLLREKVIAAGGEMVIAKNTLLKLSFRSENNEQKTENNEILQGPTAILFAYQDEVLPIKVLAEFSKANERPIIKGGLLGNSPLTVEQVMELSKLPNKLGLLVKLMRQIQAPAYGLVRTLNGNVQKLVYALQAREDMLRGGVNND
ncbi:50S ribosomal protein L10 [Candidatus Collierbacteria bacterium]|nr:50S ribosomal protein L10 [Candidatus Collierbacteria bacterium]